MGAINTTSASGGLPWYQLFDALRHVTNIYALLAFLFLVVVVVLGFAKVEARIRGISLAVLAVLVLGAVVFLLSDTLDDVAERSLVHLVNAPGRTSAEIAPGVVVELMDIDSLEAGVEEGEARSGHAFNLSLPPEVPRRVFEEADLELVERRRYEAMSQQDWEDYLDSLGAVKERTVKDIAFARLKITVDGQEVAGESRRWRFKGDSISVARGSGAVVRFTLANIYNTRTASGEPEAVNLQIHPPGGTGSR